jgi:hypothetical protein
VADFTVRYADFKGGDYGVRDPAKADKDTFKGVNVRPYDSGLLGVRAGVKQLAVTGLPPHPSVPGPLGFFAFKNALVIAAGRPYMFPMAGGAASAWATWPVAPTMPVRFLTANDIVYSLENNALYRHNAAVATTAIATPTPLSIIVRWGYYFVGVSTTVPWRLYFSEVTAAGANFDSWPANNFIDVGNTEPITALQPIFNTLYVGKRSGWNAVSGVLGTLASIRGVSIGEGPRDQRLTTITTDNRVLYWPIASAPAWFNGERVFNEDQQDLPNLSTPFPCDTVIATPTRRRLIMCSDETAGTHLMAWSERAWTHHLFPAKLAGLVPGQVYEGEMMPKDVIFAALAPTTIGDPIVIASYNHHLERPAHATDQHTAPSDVGTSTMVAGSVSFPAYWEPIGRQVRVRSVIVQFRKWASGVAATTNEMRLRVDAVGRYGGGVTTGETHTWIEPCERSSSSGTDDSWRVNVGDQGFGNGFQLNLPKLAGVAIREIVVLLDVRTERT